MHAATGVKVDVLLAGRAMPARGGRQRSYPSPGELPRSAREPDVVALPVLVVLKLDYGRHRDVADVAELLKHLDEVEYAQVEAAVRRDLRPRLLQLREDALEERRFEEG